MVEDLTRVPTIAAGHLRHSDLDQTGGQAFPLPLDLNPRTTGAYVVPDDTLEPWHYCRGDLVLFDLDAVAADGSSVYADTPHGESIYQLRDGVLEHVDGHTVPAPMARVYGPVTYLLRSTAIQRA